MERQKNYVGWAAALIVVAHLAGLLSMQWPPLDRWLSLWTPFDSLLSLTPFNLLLTTGLLLAWHRDWSAPFLWFAAACLLTGYWVEVAGVHTGLIFGQYQYGPVLGLKWLDVPLMIGVNWLLLVYSASVLVGRLPLPRWAQAPVAALLMVGIDVLIEPVAMRYDFWSWQGDVVPLQNYAAWYVVSLFLCALWVRLPFGSKDNPLGPVVYIVQLAFFGLNLLLMG